MKRFRALWLLAMVLAFLPGAARAQGTGGIGVTGQVTNGTPGSPIPVGEPVTLQFYGEGAWTTVYTTTLMADGTFRFDNLTAETDNDFVTHIVYQNVDYYSQPGTLQGESDIAADIMINEPTNDPSSVVINQAHYFIVPIEDRIQVAEYYLVGNTGDRTYVGSENADGQRATLTFAPPAEATNLAFDGPGLGERYTGDPTRFADTRPIPPGSATIDIDFNYELPFDQAMRIERALDVPITLVALIINSESIGLEGPGIIPQGMMNTQMGPAASYSAGPLAKGETLAFSFTEQTMTVPTATPPSNPTTTGPQPRVPARETGIGIVALALAGLACYLLWQPSSIPPMPEEARPLVEEIATLDASFAAGEIQEEAYQRQRATLKRRLRAQVRQS